ncbi:MAG: 2-amino-4-hydroxy-6-hydroxymethyldihydropteridine diphosphokinase [Gammaproteobacteria bacterium]
MPRVFLSIGSNIDREENIRSGVDALHVYHRDFMLSSVYESEAVGFEGDDFYNLVIGFGTSDDLKAVYQKIRSIEDQHYRNRNGPRFGPRTLDIDLLLYGEMVIKEDWITLPREEIDINAFVLWPLAEIAGDERHPVSNRLFSQLWEEFDKDTQKIRKIDFDWDRSD